MTSAHEDHTTGTGSGTDANPDIEQIQSEIEQTRQELGETVDALTAKLDVKSRARARLDDTKHRAAEQVQIAQTRAMLERYAAGGGSVRELVFDGCGHGPPVERSAEVRGELLAHIEGAA